MPPDVDISTLERVGGTAAGGYYLVAPDVLLAWPIEGYEQTVEAARASLEEQYRIAQQRRRKHVVVIMVDRVQSQDAGSRRVWSSEADPEVLAGLALVSSKPLARAIASFFLGLARPRMPVTMVATLDEALEWASETLETRGGALSD